MKKNLKLTIAALSVLLVMAIATTVASFSRAGETNKVNPLAGADGDDITEYDRNTNIDYIIMNSHTTPSKEEIDMFGDTSKYHIVEIGFGGESSFGTMAKNGDFEQFVLNGHKSASNELDMAADKVDYKYYNAKDVGEKDEDTLQTIARADFIYISNLGGKNNGSTNDLGEELYNLLHTYAIGDYKPLIIDSPNAKSGQGETGGGGGNGGSGASADSTFNTVVKDYYSKQGIYYNTYEWNSSKSAETFLQGSIGDTYYVGINSRTAQNGWKTLYEKPSDELSDEDKNNPDKLVEAKVAKILVVSGDGNTGALYNMLMGTPEPAATLYTNDGTKTEPYVPDCPMYVANANFKMAYSTRYKYRPNYVEVETAKIDDIGTVSLDGYDLVIFESTCSNVKIGAAAYDRMVAAMKSKMYIIYDSALSTSAQTQPSGNTGNAGTGTGDANNAKNSKYEELYYLVATAEGMANYANIMPTNNSTIAAMANSKSASICAPIADLINNSSYRGIGGPKGSSTSFTVLEIQPDYPIDATLAASKKSYYDEGVNMAPSGTTKDQIADKREYYDWDLSEAKIAYALNMNYEDVTVEHMSIEEFAASRTDLLGKYDLVYIGGDRSALKDGTFIYTRKGESGILSPGFNFLKSGGIGYKDIDGYRGGYFFTVGNSNARDLSDYNLEQLNEYIKAGMPLIISQELKIAYEVTNGTVENGCNMYNFIKSNNSKSNVSYGINQDDVVQNNMGGLGDTVTGTVTVFSDVTSGLIRTLYNGCTQRLMLAVTSRPPQYNLYDKSTRLTTTKLEYKYDCNVSSTKAELYVDKNNNGAFEADEAVAAGKDGSLTYDLKGYKGGLVYWKLQVSSGKSTASSTGSTYIKPNSEKKDVSVLQIIPDPNTLEGWGYARNYGSQGSVSLLFCTECQRTYMPITYNPAREQQGDYYYSGGPQLYATQDNRAPFGNVLFDYTAGKLYDGSANRNSFKGYSAYEYVPTFETKQVTPTDNCGPISVTGYITHQNTGKVYMGKHEHKFGIYKFGGSSVYGDDYDDFDWNFADELSEMYNFHIDIMTTRQYEAIDAAVKAECAKAGVTVESARADVLNAKSTLDTYISNEYATAETGVRGAIQALINSGQFNSYKDSLQRLLDEKNYYEFFSSFGYNEGTAANYNNGQFLKAYNAWALANDKKIDYTNDYMLALYKYNYLKSGKTDWMTQADKKDASIPDDEKIPASYTSVVIGAAENFGNDDINDSSCESLKAYAGNDGQIIMFHECMGRLTESVPAANITRAVLDVAGVNAYSDTQRMSKNFGNSYYKYSTLVWDDVAKWNNNADYTVPDLEQHGSNQALMNNRCAVNTFPFTLSDKLKITGTHPVGYAINTDVLSVTPLYTITTSTFNNETQKIFPASPVDGSDNAFIYSSGNFYYCGAGHSKVTGKGSNNNDERRLYINIICNSVSSPIVTTNDPTIDIFDYGTTAEQADKGEGNNYIKKTDDGYTYSVEEDASPEFTFRASADKGKKITSVNIYYKLDPAFESMTDEAAIKGAMAYNKTVDKMIADSSTKLGSSTLLDIIANGNLADIDETSCPGLKLTADMFTPYGGNYTYIVIEVKDDKGGTTYEKIKITKKPHLFDLT